MARVEGWVSWTDLSRQCQNRSRLRGMYLLAFLPVNYFLEDWQALCVLLGELYQNGELSSQHLKVIFILADFLKLIILLFLLFYEKAFYYLNSVPFFCLPLGFTRALLLYQQFKYAFACCVLQDLCEYIKRRDTLLLQAFRSSKTAGTSEQLQANFKQYLSGMLCNL